MTMDFKTATDLLFGTLSHDELAKELGISVPSIRQARLREGARALRKPPEGWEWAVARLADHRAKRLQRLSNALQTAILKAKKAK